MKRRRWIPASMVCEVSVPAPDVLARTPEECARHLFAAHDQTITVETFKVMSLTIRHRVIRIDTISVGCLTSSLVHPREVFKAALKANAAAIVLSHNHPSGDPEPSAEDIALTRRLVGAGQLMGIEVLDHQILGSPGRYVSLKQRGAL